MFWELVLELMNELKKAFNMSGGISTRNPLFAWPLDGGWLGHCGIVPVQVIEERDENAGRQEAYQIFQVHQVGAQKRREEKGI